MQAARIKRVFEELDNVEATTEDTEQRHVAEPLPLILQELAHYEA